MLDINRKIYFPNNKDIDFAREVICEVVSPSPLQRNINLSEKYHANIYLKREDLQRVRSYKIRGAFNKIKSLSKEELSQGILCASAGNHAQGVAFSCHKLEVNGKVFMPITTPRQKIEMVTMFGKEWVEVILKGDTYDDAYKAAMAEMEKTGGTFIHPFDDKKIIEGQGTIAPEIIEQIDEKVDYVVCPVGGGGLISGVGSYFKNLDPAVQIIGAEPEGAPSMKMALQELRVVELKEIDKFVDGAAVQKVGDLNFAICRYMLDQMLTVPEGKICETILDLYNKEAIVVEPAGAISIATLDQIKDQIRGKTIVCILSGSNNDIERMAEISERAMLYKGLKHYFLVRFPQRPGALKKYVSEVLGEDDDITYFEYHKKNYRNQGAVVIGIELKRKSDFLPLCERMNQEGFVYQYLNDKPDLFQFLI